ncbi:MAG: HXXEE domain-containing protein, partial [Calditrichaeota bacterium]|nr:HXXEE domain-containing protein [Calditrichota bacterium]
GYVLLLLIMLILINSVQHILTSLITREYNPGLVTAIFLNLPVTVLLLKQTVQINMIGTKDLLRRVLPVSLGLYLPVIILIWTLSFGIRSMLN